jgi:hypothetical protein
MAKIMIVNWSRVPARVWFREIASPRIEAPEYREVVNARYKTRHYSKRILCKTRQALRGNLYSNNILIAQGRGIELE